MTGKKSKFDLKWLVKRRSDIQATLLDLYEFDLAISERERKLLHPVFGLLVGIAFSLWRSVFLAVTDRAFGEILDDTNKALLILIETNAFGFPQDVATRQWMSGYYNNNAVFRLHAVAADKTAWDLLSSVASDTEREFLAQFHPSQQDRFGSMNSIDTWEEAFKGLQLSLSLLRRARSRH